jgi:D-3-phosphoglycerate dehydrogenase / 2-oxoglutarate reductase
VFKIIISEKISDSGMAVFKAAGFQADEKTGCTTEELKQILPEYDAWVVRSGTRCTAELIEAAVKLKVIGRAGVGLDNVDLRAAEQRGLRVVNTPDANTVSAAEHTFAMMLALARHIPQACLSLKMGKWERNRFLGMELCGKTLGVVGFGRIGTQVALRALAFGMKVVAFDPFIDPALMTDRGVESLSFVELIKRSDFITVHTPLTRETHGLFGIKEMECMKDGVRIVNCARGGIFDEAALYEALRNGKVVAAALDVFETEPPLHHPLLTLENVVAVPHLGAATREAREKVGIMVAEQVVKVLKEFQ